ncbi:MAG: hypothetical protein KIT23_07205 [Sphingopyxis sp.]|nr:hypothetical protein [Sphingopyxis sp.]
MARKTGRSSSRLEIDAARLKKIAVVGAASLLAGAIAFSQALSGLDSSGTSPVVLPVFRDPVAQLNLVRVGLSDDKTRIEVASPRHAASIARNSLARAPINPGAIYIFALIANGTNEPKKAARYAQLIEQLSRRHVGGQMMLADQAMRAKRHKAAISHIDRALRTKPEITPQVFPILAEALRYPDFRTYLGQSLAGSVPWRDAFFAYAAAQPYAQSGTAQLILELPGLKDSADLRLAVRSLTLGLGNSGQTDLLRRLYMHVPAASAGLKAPATAATFRDFALVEGAPPIAWDVGEDTTNGALVSAGNKTGSVNITGWAESGYGGVVATKFVWLSAGRWALRYTGSGEAGGGGASAIWDVGCVTARGVTPLTTSADIFAARGARSLGFAVPTTCPVARIQLTVRGAQSGGSSQIDLSNVHLVRAPAG